MPEISQEYYAIMTNAGIAKEMASLTSGQDFDIWEIAVGDGNGILYEPKATQVKLRRECYRARVARLEADGNKIYGILEIPANVGGFIIREIGAFDKNGNMLIIGKCAETSKRLPESGSPQQLTYRLDLSAINELVFPQIIIDPSANTPSIKYVEKYFQSLSEKGQPLGYVPLDAEGKVSSAYLLFDEHNDNPDAHNEHLAHKNGSPSETFNIADAVENSHAVNLGQLQNLIPSGTVTALGNITGSTTLAFDKIYTANITGNLTLSITLPEKNNFLYNISFEFTKATSASLTLPSSVKWIGGSAPDLSTDVVHEILFSTKNRGSAIAARYAWRAK